MTIEAVRTSLGLVKKRSVPGL
ncbi:protein of unknown function [Bradyrhizobium vignae]|uniref:Uncharacterized protein n=1 Tax=Bradyrhizobium vignae TaxID=1549949 RepID=A0A2U3Q208_9BRAD|nr:protein of unknown function [Bradyrhizobium vignae]